jgi:phospholipase/lecithinase/hemolysin
MAMHPARFIGVLGVVLLALASTAAAESFTQCVAFGDSLTDTGNLYTASLHTNPPPPYFSGRFSNGPLWVEGLSQHLGLAGPAPSLLGGTNYAWYGAQTGTGTSWKGTPNIRSQVATYLGGHTPTGTELFVIWGGANDFAAALSVTPPGTPNVAGAIANLSAAIGDLTAAGGKEFLVLNLPPLGSTPFVRSLGFEVQGNALSAQFNQALTGQLALLRSSLPVNIRELDTFSLFQQAMVNPSAFGLTNVTDPAFNGTTVVANPNEYLFWDDLHPTAAVHAILGNQAFAAVPEPSMLVLCVSGGLALVILVARRRER